MQLIPTRIPDVLILEPKVFGDQRGFFLETCRRDGGGLLTASSCHCANPAV